MTIASSTCQTGKMSVTLFLCFARADMEQEQMHAYALWDPRGRRQALSTSYQYNHMFLSVTQLTAYYLSISWTLQTMPVLALLLKWNVYLTKTLHQRPPSA